MSKHSSSETPPGGNGRSDRRLEIGIVLAAVVVAAVGARPFHSGANDASRLATVQCLVDYHTLAIDRSRWFDDTGDKIRPLPDGPYYSHQPPTLALLMAVPYLALHDGFGFRAVEHEEAFYYILTLLSAGLAYVAAVWCLYRLGRALGLSPGWAAALTASFGLSTVAPVYTRHVNAHMPLLAAAAAVLLNLAALARPSKDEGGRRKNEGKQVFLHPSSIILHPFELGRFLLIGTLAGFAYAVEQPTGGLLLAAAAVTAAVQVRRLSAAVWVALAALPWAVLHHAVTYSYTGMLGPAGANPAFWNYPGSQFDASNLTGRWNHADLGAFAAYAYLMLFGERGFVTSNPTLWLALPAAVWALRRAVTAWFGLWAVGVWLVYAALSNNYGGACATIRWFVPLLAPAYYALALLLRDRPQYRIDFVLLSAWGAVLAGFFWLGGPFSVFYTEKYCPYFPYFFWPVVAAALVTWAARRALAATGAARPR